MDTAQSTALTVAQRASVALGAAEHEKKLIALAKQSTEITAITNPAGYQQLHSARMALKNERVAIEKLGKGARDDATKFSKAVIEEEKRLIAIIEPEEKRLQAIQEEHDTRLEREKAAKIEAERIRVEHIQSAIADINQMGATLTALSGSAVIAAVLGGLKETPIDESYAEFKPDAEQAKVQATVRLHKLHVEALDHEAAQRKAKADAEEVARLRAAELKRQHEAEAVEAEANRKRQDEERAARNRILAEEQAAAERIAAQARAAQAERDEADRKAAEARAAQEAAPQAERERVAAEALALEERQRKAREEQELIERQARQREEDEARKARERNEMAMQEISGIQQQVIIAQTGRLGVRAGGTLECLQDTLAETEAWPITAEKFGALTGSAQNAKASAIVEICTLIAEWGDRERAAVEQRKADELLSARDMLSTFRNRYGEIAEFAKVCKAIDSYMTGLNRRLAA